MTWMDNARSIIAAIDAQLPANADLATRRKALRKNAWRLHQGTSWGKKVWSKAARQYLEHHGLPRKAVSQAEHLSPLERLMRNSGR